MLQSRVGDSEFKLTIAENIAKHRKRLGLTQLELAEKLNYTDKAVSKWERAEAMPDVLTLKQLADLFDITVNDFVEDDRFKNVKKSRRMNISMKKETAIPLLSVLLNFFVATVVYCLMVFFKAPVPKLWLTFIYAIPTAAIILIVFSALWWKTIYTALSVSLLTWSIALSFFLPMSNESLIFVHKPWLFFIIAAVFQVIIIAWYLFYWRRAEIKRRLR